MIQTGSVILTRAFVAGILASLFIAVMMVLSR
jgi:hypothetical protein